MLPNQDKQDAYNCPSCGSIRECILDQIPSTASYILSFSSIFLFGIWSLFIIPLIFQSTKIIVKRCYYCNTEIERQKFFAIPSLSDQVLQFKFGSCMIVLSRKYAIVLLVLFISLFCYVELQEQPIKPQQELHKRIAATWLTFLQFCGKFQMIDNGLRAKTHFENQFHNNVIVWKGYFVSAKRNYDPVHPYADLIYVKMDPTESQDDYPDLVLGMDSTLSSELQAVLANQPQGKQIEFEAIIEGLGNDFNYHVLTLKSLQVLKDQRDILKLPRFVQKVDEIDVTGGTKQPLKSNQPEAVISPVESSPSNTTTSTVLVSETSTSAVSVEPSASQDIGTESANESPSLSDSQP